MDKGSTKILKGVEGVEGVDEFHNRNFILEYLFPSRKFPFEKVFPISSELKQISKETLENPNYGT